MKKVFYLPCLLALCFTMCSLGVSAAVSVPASIYFTTPPVGETACPGSVVNFTASGTDTTGGVTTMVSYVWLVSSNGGVSWSLASNPSLYSGDSTNTLSVTANTTMNGYLFKSVIIDSNGSDTSAAASLTVLGIAPGTITGSSAVCKNSSVTLIASVSGGTWAVSNMSVATVAGGVVTGHAQGYDTVSYTDSNMCGHGTATFVVRVDTAASLQPISGPTSTCIHNTITLTDANVLGSGVWTARNAHAYVGSTGDVTGASYGVDTIYYSFSNACGSAGVASYLVSVDTVLNPGIISGSSTLCAGAWTHLSESVSGGAWFSSNSAIAVVDMSGNVTGVSQGIVTISYYLSNSCGASIATHLISLNRAASMITGNDSVGVGFTISLGDSVSGGTWTTSDSSVATVNSSTGTVTGVSAGSVTITYSVINYCGNTDAVINIMVGGHPSPGTIYGPDTVCVGHTITLVDTPVSGGVWSSSNDTFATVNATTGVVTGVGLDSGVASAPVTINYTFTNGFGDSTVSYNIVVLHTPIVSISEEPPFYNLAQTYLIKGTPGGGTWTHSNPSIASFTLVYDTLAGGVDLGTIVSYVMIARGTDVLHYSVSNECGTVDSSITASIAIDTTAGVHNINTNNFQMNVYPNPNQGQFTISLSGGFDEQASVVVTDLLGRTVEQFTMPTNKLVNVMLEQPTGVYMLSATTSVGRYTTKVSVTR